MATVAVTPCYLCTFFCHLPWGCTNPNVSPSTDKTHQASTWGPREHCILHPDMCVWGHWPLEEEPESRLLLSRGREGTFLMWNWPGKLNDSLVRVQKSWLHARSSPLKTSCVLVFDLSKEHLPGHRVHGQTSWGGTEQREFRIPSDDK